MKQIILGLALALVSGFSYAGSPVQDHTCQGGHNCNTYGEGGEVGTPTTYIEPVQNVTLSPSLNQAQLQGQSQDQSQVAVSSSSSGAVADASNKNYNSSSNDNTNIAFGGQGGSSHQGQSQSSTNNNSNSGNNQSLTVEGSGIARHYNEHGNNVNAFGPAIYSSSACTAGGLSGGASAFGMGLSLGGSKQDPQCQVRENARILSGLDATLAIMYLCANPAVDIGTVLGSACKPAEAPVVIVPEVVEPKTIPPVVVITEDVKG